MPKRFPDVRFGALGRDIDAYFRCLDDPSYGDHCLHGIHVAVAPR